MAIDFIIKRERGARRRPRARRQHGRRSTTRATGPFLDARERRGRRGRLRTVHGQAGRGGRRRRNELSARAAAH